LWTCDEFHRFGDMGVFEGRGAMLIDGVILEQGPMNAPHAITLELATDAVRLAFGAGWRTRAQLPLVLGLHTDPIPDLAVVPGRPRDQIVHPTTAALVIEVADSSLRFDTTEKLGLYAAGGIPEYWVIDINGRQLLLFRGPRAAPGHPHGHDYTSRQALGPNDVAAILVVPGATVAVADLLV
jgi:Uma2 family endonuclease